MTAIHASSMGTPAAWLLASVVLTLGAVNHARAAEPIRIDFEQGEDLSHYDGLDWGSLEAAVVLRGPDMEGHCLRLHNSAPATSCGLRLKGPLTLTKNLLLSFDYRTEIEPDVEGAYLGMIFYVDGYSTRPVPPEKYVPEWHLYATPRQPAAQEEFLAAMQIQRLNEQSDPEATIESVEAIGAHGVRILIGDRTHLVLFRKANADGLLRCDGLETDGQVAALERGRDGTVLLAMVIGARKVRYKDEVLLDAATPQDWVRSGTQ